MPPHEPFPRPASAQPSIEPIIARFEDAWQQAERPVLDDYLPTSGPERGAVLIELVHADLEFRLKVGEAARVEHYLCRYPELAANSPAVRELIKAEYELRRRREPAISADEYVQRFPQYQKELRAELQASMASPLLPALAQRKGQMPEPHTGQVDKTGVQTLEKPPHSPSVPPDGAGPPPPLRAGRYEIQEEIGRGGMGAVWRARDRDLGRTLAVKMLLARHQGDPESERRFREEAQITGQLQHPGIPPVHEVGVLADGRPFLAMKLIRGRTLADLLAERASPAVDLPRFLAIFEQVCQTLAYAHSRGVIHRDLKPNNVMVGAFGEVQVMDWGLAKVLSDERPTSVGTAVEASAIATVRTASEGLSSQAGAVLGTPAYMAPEQARGEVDELDERCDVFGLGAMLCVILTGQPPYGGTSRGEVQARAARGDLGETPARLEASGADAALVQLARECLAAEKERRPRHAGVVAEAVGTYQAGVQQRLQEAERQRAAAVARAVEERKRRRVTVALAAAVLLLAAGVGAWWHQRAERRSRTEREVTLAMGESSALAEQARGLWDRADEWKQPLSLALFAMKQAQRLLEAGEADQALRQDVARVQKELSETARGLELITDLNGIRFEPDIAYEDQRYEESFRKYGVEVLALRPADAASWIRNQPLREPLLLALWHWEINTQAEEKQQHLQQIVREAQPDRAALAELCVSQAGVLVGSDGNSRCIVALRLAIAIDPKSASAHFELGKALSAVSHGGGLGLARRLVSDQPIIDASPLDEAIAAFRKAIALDPKSAEAHSELGDALNLADQRDAAIAAHRQAIALEPKSAHAHSQLADALRQSGQLGEAIAAYRKAIALDPKRVDVHTNLGIALREKGLFLDALALFRYASRRSVPVLDLVVLGPRALRLQPRSPHPIGDVDSEIRKAIDTTERLIILDHKLDAISHGQAKPGDGRECLHLGWLCLRYKRRYAAATRFYADAFADQPALLDDLRACHRYNAACAAAQAGCGRGEDAGQLADEQRTRLRQQALAWLRADLATWSKQLESDKPPDRAAAVRMLTHAGKDPDLASVRDQDELKKLPEDERKNWQQLWADIAALLQRTDRK